MSRRDRYFWRFHLITGRTYPEGQCGVMLWSLGRSRTLDVWLRGRLYTLIWRGDTP